MKFMGIVALISALLLGCSSAPKQDEPEALDRGPANSVLSFMGNFEGVRHSDSKTAGTLNFVKLTYTVRGKMGVHLRFERKPGEKFGRVDSGMIYLYLSLDEYKKLFESNENVKLAEWDNEYDLASASAATVDGTRTVTFHARNLDKNEVVKRKTCVLVLKNGVLVSAQLTQEVKQAFLVIPIPGFKTYFKDSLVFSKKTAEGLELNDDQVLGRITDEFQVLEAINDPRPETFRKILGSPVTMHKDRFGTVEPIRF